MRLKEITLKYGAFIFDFDGVIVDSVAIKTEAFGELFQQWGPEAVGKIKEYHLANGGVSRYEKFKYYYRTFARREITAEESAQLDHRYGELVVNKVIQADLIPGVMPFLEDIKRSGKRSFVVSATPQKEVRHIVQKREMDKFFEDVLGSPASKKENVSRLLKEKGLTGREVVYFGDAKSDYEAALSCGVDFWGIIAAQYSELSTVSGIERIKNFLN